ncbi:MAG: dockerin type I domain-containing protein [Candidatus Poribacteria bacterium]|nr:dockerin type I domain-containing protein [Candidatus Poribacteria bacterium]
MYWTDTQGRIRRANFNGTDIEDVATGLIAPGQLIFGIHVTKDEERAYPAWDTNTDGITNVLDLILVAQHLGEDASANPQADVNGDGTINVLDLIVVAQNLGEPNAAGAPSNFAIETLELDPVMIQTWIAQAEAENDRSLAFRHGIENLRRLLASLLPEETALLPNYPNPLNPETWIPYRLSEPVDVTVHIYATNGALVRTLALGHQAAGIYESRSRAAYWDGKNGVGEPVASGVYFYTLTAGDFMTTRKMLIRK